MAPDGLDAELRAIEVAWPPTPDLEAHVRARLQPQPRRRLLARPLHPALAWTLAAVVAVIAGTLAVSPDARSALLELLGLRGARIERRAPDPPPAAGRDLRLGTATTLADARRRAGFAVPVPTLAALGRPDGVFLDGNRVSFVYRARAGVAPSPHTGAALLVTAFPAVVEPLIEKAAGPGVRVERLTVDGDPAFWLTGAAHGFAWQDGETARFEDQRLAGNTLLVERDGLLLRVEGEVSREQAITVVRSMR